MGFNWSELAPQLVGTCNEGKAFDFDQKLDIWKWLLVKIFEGTLHDALKRLRETSVLEKCLLTKVKHHCFNSPKSGIPTSLERFLNIMKCHKRGKTPYRDMRFWKTLRITTMLNEFGDKCMVDIYPNMITNNGPTTWYSTIWISKVQLVESESMAGGLWQDLSTSRGPFLIILEFSISATTYYSNHVSMTPTHVDSLRIREKNRHVHAK